MRLEEIGIVHQGKLLLVLKNHDIISSATDHSLIGCYFTAIQDFNIKLFLQNIEILSGKSFCVVFCFQSLRLEALDILPNNSDKKELEDFLLGYILIRNKRKKLEAYSRKKILPLLEKIMLRFKYKYLGSDFVETSMFEEFEAIIVDEFKKRRFVFS